MTFTAPDGAAAECHPPFAESFALPEGAADAGDVAGIAAAIAAHAAAPRTVGVLLVRLGGYAAGVFTGYPPVLADAKVGSRPVHGRSAAGGWSQHRFARRREKQASEAIGAAVGAALLVFGRSGTTAPGGPEHRPAARWTRSSLAATSGRPPSCAATRAWRRTWPWPPSGSSPFPTRSGRCSLGAPALFAAVRIRLSEP